MITSTKNIFELKEKEIGYLSKTGKACSSGQTYPIYIPRLMPKIKQGPPIISIKSSKGATSFLNAPGCRIFASPILRSKNYIEVPFERNKSWKGQSTENENGEEIISEGIKVTIHCGDSSFKNMTFSND